MPTEISGVARLFNLSEAQELLPMIVKITQKHRQELEPVRDRLKRMLSNDPRRASLEKDYESHVSIWRGKVERLGVKAAGLWEVEFDVGEGVLHWRYPELQIAYFRPQHATIRKKMSDYIEEHDPDWAL